MFFRGVIVKPELQWVTFSLNAFAFRAYSNLPFKSIKNCEQLIPLYQESVSSLSYGLIYYIH